jgi:hypothetical protein
MDYVLYVKILCQVLVALSLSVAFFQVVRQDIEGVNGKPPAGFHGFIFTVASTAIIAAVLYGSGAFSELF